MAVLLIALLTAAGMAFGLATSQNVDQAVRESANATGTARTLSLVGAITLLVILFAAYFCGNCVAGRMARFNGIRQGLAVWLWGVVIAVIFAALAAVAGSQYNVYAQLNLPRIPVGRRCHRGRPHRDRRRHPDGADRCPARWSRGHAIPPQGGRRGTQLPLNPHRAGRSGSSASSVARAARVHRSFIYRHGDLHVAVHDQAARDTTPSDGTRASRQALQADLANALERSIRQAQRISQLEKKLSHVLVKMPGEKAVSARRPISTHYNRGSRAWKQQLADTAVQLAARDVDLEPPAARTGNSWRSSITDEHDPFAVRCRTIHLLGWA